MESQGHRILGTAGDRAAALDMLDRLSPDLAVLGCHLPDASGPQLARDLCLRRPLPVVLLSTNDQPPPELAHELQVIHCWLPWPVDPHTLGAGVLAVHQSFARVQSMQREISDLGQALEVRKVTERAKGLLMESRGISEDQAQAILRQRAENQGVSLARAARQVVEANVTDAEARQGLRRDDKGSRPE